MATAGSSAATVAVSVTAVDSSSSSSPGPVSVPISNQPAASERNQHAAGQRNAAVLSGGSSGVMQYLNPDYSPSASLSLDSKNSPLALLARTCNNIGKDLVMSCGSRSAISQLHQAALHHQSGPSVITPNNYMHAAPESSKTISPLGDGLLPRKPTSTNVSRPELMASNLRHHDSSSISRSAASHRAHADVNSGERNVHVTSPRRPLQVDSSTSVVRQPATFSRLPYVNTGRNATGNSSRQYHAADDVEANHHCNNRRSLLQRTLSDSRGKLIADKFITVQRNNNQQLHHRTGNGNNMADEIDVVEEDDDESSAPPRDDEDSNSFSMRATGSVDAFQNRYESDFQTTVDAAIRRESIQRLLQSHDAIALQAAALAAAAAASPYHSPQTMQLRYSPGGGVPAALPPYLLPGGRLPPVAELSNPALYSAFLAAAAAAQQQYLNHVIAGRHYGGGQLAPTGGSVAGSAGFSSNASPSSASSPENICNSSRLESAPMPAATSPFTDDVTLEEQQQNGDNDCPTSTTVVTSGGASGSSESAGVNYVPCNCLPSHASDYSNEQLDNHRHHTLRKRHQPRGVRGVTTQQQLSDSLGQTFEPPSVDSSRAVSSLMLQTAAAAAAAAAATGRFPPIHTGNVAADIQPSPSLSCNWMTSSGEFCGRRFATGNELLHHLQSHVVCNEQHSATPHDVDHMTAAILAAGLFQPSPFQSAAATAVVAGNVPSIHSLRMLGATDGHHLSANAATAAVEASLNQNSMAGLQSLHGTFHCNNSLLHGSSGTSTGPRSPRTMSGCGKSPPPPTSMSAAAAASGSLLLHAAAMAAAAVRYHPYKWPGFQETRHSHTAAGVVQPSAYLNSAGSLPFGSLFPGGLSAAVGPKC